MKFKKLADSVKDQFIEIQKTGKLFKSKLSGQELWDLYLSSFKPGDNPVFRDPESSSHNCNLDKSFIRRYGNIVAVDKDFNIITMFDFVINEESKYYSSIKAMQKALKESEILDVFFETFDELHSLPYEKTTKTQAVFRLGFPLNHKIYTKEEAAKFGVVVEGQTYQFSHFYGDLNKLFVDTTGKSQASILSLYRADKDVFKRGMVEIPLDTLELVKDLINQGSLLDGQTHLFKIDAMIPFKKEFNTLSSKQQDNWAWVKSFQLNIAKFRGELIGTLCVDLATGVELNTACQTWNKRVDPANYMKAKAPITQKQIREAQEFVEENGYAESFDRRLATIDDINVNEILHANIASNVIKTASVFDSVKPSTSTRHKRSQFDSIEEVSIEKFMKDILPTCTSIEAFFENRLEGNLVALTKANSNDSKVMFKWDNNYSWTYKGNLAGKSLIKEAVKTAGGKVDGVLRCSLMWNDEDTNGNVDFDLHCKESKGAEIYYGTKKSFQTGGWLDVDMIRPVKIGIENISWQSKLQDMTYHFYVRNFDGGRNTGFKVEIEFDGNTFNYFYQTPAHGDIKVATVTVKAGVMTIEHHLPETTSSKTIWNIETNKFHKVNLVCLSPNYWSDNNVGNKHYLFMLEDCKTDSDLRSFHNENLNSDLLAHRKVTEVLGNTTMIEPTEKQLSGLGFNATIKDDLILKLSGTHKRTIKVKFN